MFSKPIEKEVYQRNTRCKATNTSTKHPRPSPYQWQVTQTPFTSQHRHHTSINKKGIKIKGLFQASHGIQPKITFGHLFTQAGSCICFWSSSPTADQTLLTAHYLLQTPQKETTPFKSCQSLWLTSCCNKHGKDSVSLAEYFSYVLQTKYVRTPPPPSAATSKPHSHKKEFSSHPVNKTSVKPSVWENGHDPPSWQASIRTTSTWGD